MWHFHIVQATYVDNHGPRDHLQHAPPTIAMLSSAQLPVFLHFMTINETTHTVPRISTVTEVENRFQSTYVQWAKQQPPFRHQDLSHFSRLVEGHFVMGSYVIVVTLKIKNESMRKQDGEHYFKTTVLDGIARVAWVISQIDGT